MSDVFLQSIIIKFIVMFCLSTCVGGFSFESYGISHDDLNYVKKDIKNFLDKKIPNLNSPKFQLLAENTSDDDIIWVDEETARKELEKNKRVSYKSSSKISIWGGLGFGAGSFSANLALGYGLNKYLFIEPYVFYNYYNSDDFEALLYGAELCLILKLFNPTILTPFFGVGSGWDKWQRTYKQQTYDDHSSLTGVLFVGMYLNLTKHFGIFFKHKYKYFVNHVPYKLTSDMHTKMSNPYVSNEIGFMLMF